MVSTLLLFACTDSLPEGAVAARSAEVVGTNGISANGISANGISANGLLLNGISANGISANGISANGILLNGISANGMCERAVPITTSALDGLYINRIATNGVAADGLDVSLASQLEHARNGLVIAGIGLRQTGPDALGTSATGTPGMDLGGISVNTFYIRGDGAGSLVVGGQSELGAVGLGGLVVNGAGAGALRVRLATDEDPIISDLDPAREAALEAALHHLVGCALPAGDAVTMQASDGSLRIYHGARGLAPEWRDGALSQEGEEHVRACLESAPDAVMGLAFNIEQERHLITLLRYMVECALDEDDSAVIYTGDGTALTLQGALGMAPAWKDTPLDLAGQRAISACLAARTNALEQTVVLSLRGDGIETTLVEREIFTTHEGAFWGNLFAAEPSIQTCSGEGGGLSGRVCAQGECGFTHMGDCATVCAEIDPDDGSFAQCAGETTVVSSFLSLGHRVHATNTATSCFVAQNRTLWCWGNNEHGQVGDGSTSFRDTPFALSVLGAQVVEASLGRSFTCARQRDGSLWCWGRNDLGQLGDGSTASRHAPVAVTSLEQDVATVQAGLAHACAVKTDGSAWCWGDNARGQLGASSQAALSAAPVRVTGMDVGVARVTAAMSGDHTCALSNDGHVWCWGANHDGQLGDGSTQDRGTAVHVSTTAKGGAFESATDVCAIRSGTCARTVDGTVWCWGAGLVARPVEMSMPANAAPGGLACGEDHLCVVTEDSTVWCAGSNQHGQLGQDTTLPGSLTLLPVPGLDAVSVAMAGHTYTCALRVDGSTWCWGSGNGLFPIPLSATPTEIPWDLCGDGVCSPDEDAMSCPADCAAD